MNHENRDGPAFWRRSSIEGILASEARLATWGMEPPDAMSRVWLVLTSRLPTGDPPGDAPDALLGETIRSEARKYFTASSSSGSSPGSPRTTAN